NLLQPVNGDARYTVPGPQRDSLEAAMSNGLPRERKIVLYGLQFAAGSASLRPDSDATVKQVSALLHQHRKLKVYIVGHTDNSGLLEQNLVLSRQRAQAVELGCWTMACVLGT